MFTRSVLYFKALKVLVYLSHYQQRNLLSEHIRIQATDAVIFAWRAGAAPAQRVPSAARKHDFYYHLNGRKRHVNCAVCRALSKHRSDYFVYASGAKHRYKFETL